MLCQLVCISAYALSVPANLSNVQSSTSASALCVFDLEARTKHKYPGKHLHKIHWFSAVVDLLHLNPW